jgi:uncharacterized protein (DUF608 family)
MHLTQDWRDLNLKFVLQAYRDFALTNNETYIRVGELVDNALHYESLVLVVIIVSGATL